MKTFAVDKNNDFLIGPDGNFVILEGLDAIIQSCEQASKAQMGEMIFAVNQGMPNFQAIWNGSPNVAQFEAALRKTLLRVPGVLSIVDLTTTLKNNVLSYVATINTV